MRYKKVLVTGFAPFDGRGVNSSWLAAQALAASHTNSEIRSLLIPVQWGAPATHVRAFIENWTPDCIVGLGEGKLGMVQLETLARNTRGHRQDNEGRLPNAELIDPSGPDQISSLCNSTEILETLAHSGFTTSTSTDAGQYICEELLYTIECIRRDHEEVKEAFFIHIPPHGTDLTYNDVHCEFDANIIREFSKALLDYL